MMIDLLKEKAGLRLNSYNKTTGVYVMESTRPAISVPSLQYPPSISYHSGWVPSEIMVIWLIYIIEPLIVSCGLVYQKCQSLIFMKDE